MTDYASLLPQEEKPIRKKDVFIMISVNFLSAMGFSVILPSLWPFIKSVGGVQSMVGWTVAANSAGNFLASPLLGYWSDKRTSKEVIIVALLAGMVGNIAYSLSVNPWMILIGRFVVGISMANGAVSAAYLSYLTPESKRTLIYSLNSGSTLLGFVLGPACSALTTIKFLQFSHHFKKINFTLSFTELTAPGYLSAFFLGTCLLGVLLFFKEADDTQAKKIEKKRQENYIVGGHRQVVPWLPLLILIYSNFCFITLFTIMETLGTPITTAYYNWTISNNSVMWTVMALLCVIILVALQFVIKMMKGMAYERILILVAEGFMCLGVAVLVSSKVIPQWRFLMGIVIACLGYAFGGVITMSLYTRFLESFHKRGTFMGYFSASGSVSRMVAPLLGSYVYEYAGAKYVWLNCCILLLIAMVLAVGFFSRLKPEPRVVEEETVSINDP